MTLIEEQGTSVPPAPAGAGLAAAYERHAAEVYGFVYRRCGDPDLADDIAQDTFVAALRTFEDPAELSVGWLMRAARNRLIDVIRRQGRFETKLRLLGSGDDATDEGEVVAEGLQVRDALAALKVEHRLVLILHYVDGVPLAELAEELGRPREAVKTLVRRARQNLLRELERAGA